MKKCLLLILVGCLLTLCACGTTGIDTPLPTVHMHQYTETPEMPPSCTESGIAAKRVCDCGYFEGGQALPALGHSFVSYPAEEATPSKNGHTAYSKCSVCEYTEGYSETEYVYPCVGLLPSVYDRISIFSLTEAAKQEILGMYDAVMSFEATYTPKSQITLQQLEQYYKILAFSLPETMMIYSTYRYNNQGSKITSVTFNYVLTQQQYIDKMTALEKVVKDILSDVQNMSDFEKIKYFNNYLIENCTYTLDAADVTNAYGALINGINHCDGFSDAMNLLCNASGINCQTVLGYTAEYHAWNIVQLDDRYYYLDLTTNNVDWYNKPLYVVFCASRNYIEAIGYTPHQDYEKIVPAAPYDLDIGNRYMPAIKAGEDAKTAMTNIGAEIAKNKPKHIYIRCDGQETYDSAKQYSTTIVHNAIKAAYPTADVQYMNKNTFKIICIIITY